MTREQAAALGLDIVESAAGAVSQRGGAVGTVGTLVSVGARVASRLLRSGLTAEEAVERIEAIRPHRADAIDGDIDDLIDRMPGAGDGS